MDRQNFDHAKLLVGWPIYIIFYMITECIPLEHCHVVHCALDDMIPFNEYFAVFYYGWYILVGVSLFYFLLYDSKRFEELQTFIIVTQILEVTTYIVYPTIQIGRPNIMGDNIFCNMMQFMYAVDTPTGVCPSLHVAYSVGIISVWLKRKNTSVLLKWFIFLFSVMVCCSVVFVKQHSIIDVFAGIAISIIAEWVVYREWHKSMTKLVIAKYNQPDFLQNMFR